jgi:hypothetical protein
LGPTPVAAQLFEQFRAEHDVAILPTFALLDVDHHARAIDITDFQAHQFLASHAGAIEQQQPNAMQLKRWA